MKHLTRKIGLSVLQLFLLLALLAPLVNASELKLASGKPAFIQLDFHPKLQPSAAQLFSALRPAVVALRLYERKPKGQLQLLSTFSGITISAEGELLTSLANLAPAFMAQGQRNPFVEISLYDEQTQALWPVEYCNGNETSDLALLSCPEAAREFKPVQFSSVGTVQVAAPVYIIAAPSEFAEVGSFSAGYVSEVQSPLFDEFGEVRQFVQSSAFVPKSSSGALVVNERGEVLGMTSCALQRNHSDRMGYFIPAKRIAAKLEKLRRPPQEARLSLGLLFVAPKQYLARCTSLGLPPGLCLGKVIQDSPAYVAKLEEGDILLEVNGQKLSNLLQLRQALQAKASAAGIEFLLWRQRTQQEEVVDIYLSDYGGEQP